MKTSFQKPSFGNGYGINIKSSQGASALPTAEPPLGRVTVKPGSGYSRSAVGMSGKKHFQGAKVISGKK